MNKISLAFILMFVIAFSCNKKSKSGCHYDSLPSSLILSFQQNGTIVADDILGKVKLSYFVEEKKMYVEDFTINNFESSYQHNGLISTRTIGLLSADNNIKVYYLEYNNGWKTDTLSVDYFPRSEATDCNYLLNNIKVNGKVAARGDNDFFGLPVYLVIK